MANHTGDEVSVEWRSPSNLAIVKYWGKQNVQEPLNPNISFTLKNAVTTTRVTARPSNKVGFSFYLDGELKESFHPKIADLLDKAASFLPFVKTHQLIIESSNTFPHSSGIASSASGMSALALCLADLQLTLSGKPTTIMDMRLVSEVARLGSGSAARSVYGGWTVWGASPSIPCSSNGYAIELQHIHPNFMQIANAILIVEPSQKRVSSSQGHALMKNHPYSAARIKQANNHAHQLLEVLKKGDWNQFFTIAENEALSLHGLMMSSNPAYTLLHPNSLKIIEAVVSARTHHNLPVGFSMDAGPNVHLLYPKYEETRVLPWMEEVIQPLCYKQTILLDELGNGPEKVAFRN